MCKNLEALSGVFCASGEKGFREVHSKFWGVLINRRVDTRWSTMRSFLR